MRKYYFLLFLVLTSHLYAQNVNTSPSFARPNGTGGTVFHELAVISQGQAVSATNASTNVPAYIVTSPTISTATGQAFLALPGGGIPCYFDSNFTASAGAVTYVIVSTTAAPQCHATATAPASGTGLVGYLLDASTTLNQTSVVQPDPQIFGGSGGGGSGTVTAVTVTSANGVSATVANQGTTPALTFTLGAITPSGIVDTGISAGTNPICPNGSGGAFTTSGCSGGGSGPGTGTQYYFPYWATPTTLGSVGSTITGQIPLMQHGAAPIVVSAGLADSAASPVSTTPYTIQCDSATTIIDRTASLRFQSGASAITVPLSSASGCLNLVTSVMDETGTLTFSRTSPDTFSVYNGATAMIGATSFTLSNGQFATLSQAAAGIWEVRITSSGGTVSTFSVVSANGISASVVNPTTAPAATFTLGAITPSSIVDTGITTSPSTSPICPGGTGGAFTTSGCVSGSSGVPFAGPNPWYDVTNAAFGALGNSNGTSGNGNDDSTAIATCLASGYRTCYLPALNGTSTTHYRWATAQAVTNGGWRLSCGGSNHDGSNSTNLGAVEIDVDMGSGTAPALLVGSMSAVISNGPTIDENCYVKDISPGFSGHTGASSPGGWMTLWNVSNVYIHDGGGRFLADPLLVPTNPSTLAVCTNSGGSIASGGTLYEQLEWMGANYGLTTPSTETSATLSSLGCTTGSSCSCTPIMPATIPASHTPAVGLVVAWSKTSGAEIPIGTPYATNVAGNAQVTTNLNIGGTNATAIPVTQIPTSGGALGLNLFNATGGNVYNVMNNTTSQNCALNSSPNLCVNASSNRVAVQGGNFGAGQGNTISVNIGISVPAAAFGNGMQTNEGNCPNTAGICNDIVSQAGINVIGPIHMDGSSNAGGGWHIQTTGPSQIMGVTLEGETGAYGGVQCISCKGAIMDIHFANVIGTTTGFGFSEDSTSRFNTLRLDNTTVTGITFNLTNDLPVFTTPVIYAGTPGTTGAVPTCGANTRGLSALVSDATTPTYLGNYTSGGSSPAAVFCPASGSNWVTH